MRHLFVSSGPVLDMRKRISLDELSKLLPKMISRETDTIKDEKLYEYFEFHTTDDKANKHHFNKLVNHLLRHKAVSSH